MALSDQLRAIAQGVGQQAKDEQSAGTAQVGVQTQQALGQQPAGTQGATGSKAAAQQVAQAVTQANQQVANQAQQGLGQMTQQLGQQGLQQQGAAAQLQIGKQQLLNEGQIAELQRQGKLRQNSAQLKQAKRLQDAEIAQNQRLLSARLQFDNRLSFLTRKQREDLAKLGRYTKKQLFDDRLTFENNENGRKFSNLRQLADYAVLTAQREEELYSKLQTMQQAADKEIMVLEHAHKLITQRLDMEFRRAEANKDYALMKDLAKKKQALEEKMARKAARGAAVGAIVKGGLMIGGAVAGSYMGSPYAGAAAGSAAGDVLLGAYGASGGEY